MNYLKIGYYAVKARLTESRLYHNLPVLKGLTTFNYFIGGTVALVGANHHNFKTGFALQVLAALIVNNFRRWWSIDRRTRHYLLFYTDSPTAIMEYLFKILSTNSRWSEHFRDGVSEQPWKTLRRLGVNVTFVNLTNAESFTYSLLKDYVTHTLQKGDRIDGIIIDDLIRVSDNLVHRESVKLLRRIRSELLPDNNGVVIATTNLSVMTRQTSWIDDRLFCSATQEVDVAFQVSIKREVPQPNELFRVAPELQLDLVKYRGLEHKNPRLRVPFGDHQKALQKRPYECKTA